MTYISYKRLICIQYPSLNRSKIAFAISLHRIIKNKSIFFNVHHQNPAAFPVLFSYLSKTSHKPLWNFQKPRSCTFNRDSEIFVDFFSNPETHFYFISTRNPTKLKIPKNKSKGEIEQQKQETIGCPVQGSTWVMP